MNLRKIYVGIIGLLLLNACVVKSLNPFYTQNSISFDERFLGEWIDSKKGKWKVVSFASEMTKDNPLNKMKEDDLAVYKKYNKSYYIERDYKGLTTLYVVTPFKINGQRFLDFYPVEYQDDVDALLSTHIVYSHSLVKYEVLQNGNIEVKWLDEDKIEKLFEEKRIKISHKKIGVLEDKYLLTASSEELERFIEKYINSGDEKKWSTSTKFTLTPIHDN